MNNLKNKKLALVFGQSIEGCGVTRTGAEMQIWAKKQGLELKIYSYDERMYNRREAHVLDFTSFTQENIEETVKELNEFDVVIFNSYPSAKFENKSIINFYENFIKKISTIKVGFMHELNKTNIDKVPLLVGIMNQMDLIYNFSEETWFSKTISSILPSKEIGKRVKKFTMWFNFEELKEKYRDKFSLEEKENKIMYIGRWTTMKDPRRLLDMAPIIKEKDPEMKIELKGIERSIGAKCDIFDHPNCLDCTGKNVPQNSSGFVPVYGPYVREEGMESLAKCLFGTNLYRMPKSPGDYGDRMEYTQIETIAVGTIPVFDKHWGENNKTRDGRRYIDIPYSAIYSDKENIEDTVNKLISVSKNIEEQKKYRETSFEITKLEFDANIVLPEMFNHIFEIGKDTNKFLSDDELILHITQNPEYVMEFNNQKNNKELVSMGIRELTENILCVLDGKKEKEIKRWKIKKKK